MAHYGLEFTDLFAGSEALLPDIVERYLNKGTAALFADVEERINTELHRLDDDLSGIDPTLVENLAKRRRKIMYHIAALRNKFHHMQVRKDETINRRIEAMFASLLPAGALQERSLNVGEFINRYGINFIDWVYQATDLDDAGHRLIYL
jgi:uncharacterized protein YllA (UPF0747 family)